MTFGNNVPSANNENSERVVHWQAIPDSAQELAIDTRADQTLFCGTRGSGKTIAQLMCFRKDVGVGFAKAWRGVIFDVEYKPLEDIKAKTMELFVGLGDGATFNESKYFWHWPTGEKLFLRAARTVKDAEDYLGHEYPFIGFNELSKWPTSELYDRLLGTQRCAKARELGIRPKVFSTTNPYGAGTAWIKSRFIEPAPYGVVVKEEVDVPVGQGKTETIVKSSVALAGSFEENPFYPPEQVATLMQAVRDNPHLEAAWLRCDWDAAYVDGVLGDLWDRSRHIVANFPIPNGWRVNRAFDWGSTAPFAVGWFAESNGEEFEFEGQKHCYPRGSVIMFEEWYGTKKIGTNRGLKLTPAQIAVGIKSREYDMVAKKILQPGQKVFPGPADNQISDVTRRDIDTIEKTMRNCGVWWEKSDKSPGSRRAGLQRVRHYLRNGLTGEGPGLYVQQRCQAAIKLLPPLQREGEDIAKDQEDHIYDMLRYRLSKKASGSVPVDIRVH